MSKIIDFPETIAPHTFGASYEISSETRAAIKPFIYSTTSNQPEIALDDVALSAAFAAGNMAMHNKSSWNAGIIEAIKTYLHFMKARGQA